MKKHRIPKNDVLLLIVVLIVSITVGYFATDFAGQSQHQCNTHHSTDSAEYQNWYFNPANPLSPTRQLLNPHPYHQHPRRH